MLPNKLEAQYDLSGWFPDDTRLLYSANVEHPSNKDPIEHKLESGELRRMMTGHRNFAVGYSPGYATLNAITRLPDFWSVAVVAAGPSNLVNFVQSVPEFWKPIMKTWVGDAVEDYDLLLERSPITYLEHIKVPLLVIHGANDPRVTQAESDQMVERMKALDIDVTYYVDPEEGHGPVKRANALKWWKMIAQYLQQHLNPE